MTAAAPVARPPARRALAPVLATLAASPLVAPLVALLVAPLVALLVAPLARPLAAQGGAARPGATLPDSGAFVTRLGVDTLAIERFVRTADGLEAEGVIRVPATTRARWSVRLAPTGEMVRMETVTRAVRGEAATTREVITRVGDSLRVETTASADTGTRTRARTVAAPRGTLRFVELAHWPYELALLRARATGRDSVAQPLLTGARAQDFAITRIGPDSVTITHPFRGTMRARVDGAGRLVGLDAAATTRKLVVERRSWVELDSAAARWAALDARGRALGDLSGRGEARGTIAGATITVDYGTPAARGRAIWGGLVPYGQLWRTGANRATHLTTDRALVLGAGADTLRLPAGSYTLFSIPERDGGVLIVSRQTGQNGNAYDAAHDLGRVRLAARPLAEQVEQFTIAVTPTGVGGELRLQWDRTELVVPVRPR